MAGCAWCTGWVLAFAGLVSTADAQQTVLPPLVTGDRVGAGWQFNGLPQQQLPRTQYDSVLLDGQRVLRVDRKSVV